MLLDDKIFDLWMGNISKSSSVKQYRPKVTRYFEKNKNIEIKESLNENRLLDYMDLIHLWRMHIKDL